ERLPAVPTDASPVGKRYPAVDYAVGREKIREFAAAVGETNPLHFDLEAARAAGYDDLVAPPMFVVVFVIRSIAQPLFDPALGINFAMLVHGAQEFVWGPPIVAGDEIATATTVKDISERGEMTLYVFESTSTNQRRENVCTSTWTNIVRG